MAEPGAAEAVARRPSSFKLRWLAVGCLAWLVLGWLGWPEASRGQAGAAQPSSKAHNSSAPANVLLITVDTLRPDALGWVAGKNDTPHMDRLAMEGVRFPAAVSPVPLTLPSHASMLTGLIPRRHGVRDNGQVFRATVPTLVGRFKEAGYSTAAFVSGYPLRDIFGLDQDFDHYDDTLPEGEEGWLERPAGETTDAAVAWLQDAAGPWFLWIHYYDPHDPYDPPRAFWKPGPRGLYDGEVTLVDDAVGRLLAGLRDRHPGPLLTVFAADHGESLGEHEESTHGFFIYDATQLVPLVFHFPGRLKPAAPPAEPRLVDLAPTVLELLDLAPLPEVDGVSLTPLFAGRSLELPPAYIETHQPWISYGWAPLRAVRHQGWKLVAAPRPELYDLGNDPGEQTNLVDEQRRQARALQGELRKIEALPEASSLHSTEPEVAAELRALGYLGSGSANTGAPPNDLPDPKDRLRLRNILAEGEALMQQGQYGPAVARFEAVLAEESNNRFATLRAGIAWLKAGQLERAVQRLQAATKLDPDQAEGRYALADALSRLGRFAEATQQWMETLRLQPRRVAAWSNLGTVLYSSGEQEKALEALGKAVELEPERPELHWNLAGVAVASGRDQLALRSYLQAESLFGGGGFPYSASLGLLLVEAGRRDEAKPRLERSQAGEPQYGEGRLALARLLLGEGKAEEARNAVHDALRADPSLTDQVRAEPALARLAPEG